MKIKLHWKLTIIFCLAILVGLLVGYVYLAGHLRSYVENNLENDLKRQLLLGRDLLEERLERTGSLAEAGPIAAGIARTLDARVTVITKDGTVIADTDLDQSGIKRMENHLNRPEIRNAMIKGFGTSKRYSYSVKRDLLYEAVPFDGNKIQGFLRLAVPLSAIELLEQKMKQIIIFAVLLVFIASLLFTSFISFVVSRPLVEMAGIARAMAGGDFSRKTYPYSKDEVGELARALGHLADQVRGQIEKIKHEGAKLDAVLSSLFEGIMVVNEKGAILLANPSVRKLFFIDSDADGKSPVEILRNAGIQNIVDNILKEKSRLISEEIVLAKPEEKILQVNGVPIIRDGRLEGAALVFHDITHLRHLERVRQDFVANVSHELRTPVSSIKGYAETLLGGAMKNEGDLKDFLEIIYQDSGRLAALIDDLLDLSKIESGKMPMVFEPLEISAVIKRCLNVLDKTIKEKSLSVTVDLPQDLPKVSADRERCPQVFLNLLDNAVKYTSEGGSIKVGASAEDQLVQVNVSDTGIGIPETDLPRIFERFYRVDKGRSRELGGTGLGLSIVKHIVQAHGGQVRVESVLGQGSTFSFTFPRA